MSKHVSDTVAATATHLVEVKHSRFLAQAAAVGSAEAAMVQLAAFKDSAASHNCWAWRIGDDYRFNDDGEPASTAGRPILAAIDGQGFDRVLVVVTRWFGGVKLGAGGLVRAYGGAAAECLRTAQRRALIRFAECTIAFSFGDTGAVHAALAAHAAEKIAESFDPDGTRLQLRLPADQVDALKSQLRDATRNRVWVSVLQQQP